MKNSIPALLIIAAGCVTGAAPSIAATIQGPPPPCSLGSLALTGSGTGANIEAAMSECESNLENSADAQENQKACSQLSTGTVLCQAELIDWRDGVYKFPTFYHDICSATATCVGYPVY